MTARQTIITEFYYIQCDKTIKGSKPAGPILPVLNLILPKFLL